jgi:membrane associated rhomboid family serine protease
LGANAFGKRCVHIAKIRDCGLDFRDLDFINDLAVYLLQQCTWELFNVQLTKFHYFGLGRIFDWRGAKPTMMNDDHFKFTPQVLLLPLYFVLALWVVFWVEKRFDFDFGVYGIYPRDIIGLRGVVLSPFIHGNIGHLYNNSIPLAILIAALSYFYRELTYKILGLGIIASGLLTWLIARDNYHIGASGLIYVLVTFIFFKGILTKYYRLVALSLTVAMLYGGMVWYVFPDIEDGISWEGHLAGMITGLAFALIFKTPEYRKMIRYDWERPDYDASQDKFMQRFDENGNFVNPPKPEPEDEELAAQQPTVHYIYKPKENGEPH